VALGGNQGDVEATMRSAVAALGGLGEVRGVSSAYRTRAVGPPQPDYLNAVAELATALPPRDLLHRLQAVEAGHGRVRGARWGPRTLDLDLVWYEGELANDAELTLPHPRAHEREFVLRPLADLDPEVELRGRPARAWLEALGDQGVTRIALDLSAQGGRAPGRGA
jgi:2-amino-4-hydroxy-6-hydroxymethyldihydropteridine diphosphokinase